MAIWGAFKIPYMEIPPEFYFYSKAALFLNPLKLNKT